MLRGSSAADLKPANTDAGQKYRCDLEAKARDLLKKIKHINKEAIRAMRECEEHHVRHCRIAFLGRGLFGLLCSCVLRTVPSMRWHRELWEA